MRRNNSGYVVVTALIIAAILSVILFSLVSAAMSVYKKNKDSLPKNQAYYTALSGLETVVGMIDGKNADGAALDKLQVQNTRTYIIGKLSSGRSLDIDFGSNPAYGGILGRCEITGAYDTQGDLIITSRGIVDSQASTSIGGFEEYRISAKIKETFDGDKFLNEFTESLKVHIETNPADIFGTMTDLADPAIIEDGIYRHKHFWYIEPPLDTYVPGTMTDLSDPSDPDYFDGTIISGNPLDELDFNGVLFIFINQDTAVKFEALTWEYDVPEDEKYGTVYIILNHGALIRGLHGLDMNFSRLPEDEDNGLLMLKFERDFVIASPEESIITLKELRDAILDLTGEEDVQAHLLQAWENALTYENKGFVKR